MKKKERALDFLNALRKSGFSCNSLTIGDIIIDGIVDMTPTKPAEKPEPPKSMFERFGAALLEQPAVSPSDEIPDEAKEPD